MFPLYHIYCIWHYDIINVHCTLLNARFALFLLLVIKKLMSLTSANAGLQVTTTVDTWHVARGTWQVTRPDGCSPPAVPR